MTFSARIKAPIPERQRSFTSTTPTVKSWGAQSDLDYKRSRCDPLFLELEDRTPLYAPANLRLSDMDHNLHCRLRSLPLIWNAHCQLDLKASDPILLNMPADSAQIALERVLAAVGQCLDRRSAESAAPSSCRHGDARENRRAGRQMHRRKANP